ncbi:MAG: acylphosphatase [Alphaproteobacteria bacterium]|nr:acylphosphatase [Alphaproteobacteria bacterium]MBF0251933.1 acylphosphatase [Alphaproteobacteria bacterium]
MADDDEKDDNVVAFRRPERPRVAWRKARASKPKRQFQHHDRVVRLRVRGLVQNDAFVRWLVELAVELRLDGWARSAADNSMDILLAGEDGDVRQMVELLRDGPRPVDMMLVEEIPLKGDEPLWQGFHHMSPSGR